MSVPKNSNCVDPYADKVLMLYIKKVPMQGHFKMIPLWNDYYAMQKKCFFKNFYENKLYYQYY